VGFAFYVRTNSNSPSKTTENREQLDRFYQTEVLELGQGFRRMELWVAKGELRGEKGHFDMSKSTLLESKQA